MDAKEMKRIILLLSLLALAGCGLGEGGQGSGVAVRVTKAASFDPSIEHGRIERYVVSISGEGIDAPITGEFPGDTEEGVVEGVPAGGDRTVEVRAMNPNGVAIRGGEAFGVSVGGGITEVSIELESIPIFTNIADGNTIDNTRLVFRIFSDPANPVIVEEADGPASPLVDASRGVPELYLDESTGMGTVAPGLIEPGEHSFAVRDAVTGRSHAVDVRLVDGTGRRPAPLVSAAATEAGIGACSAPVCAP